MTSKNEDVELKWRIIGDVIGHSMTTKEIVEMYAEDYGYSRHNGLVPLDFEKLWVEFENFLMPHTSDLIIQPSYARNAEHFKYWLESVCSRFGTPPAKSVPTVKTIMSCGIDDDQLYRKNGQWFLSRSGAKAIHALLKGNNEKD